MSNSSFQIGSQSRTSSSSSRSLPTATSALEPPHVTLRRPATARTLRSSPLARSSASEEPETEGLEKPRYRPSRISSTPDLAADATNSIYSEIDSEWVARPRPARTFSSGSGLSSSNRMSYTSYTSSLPACSPAPFTQNRLSTASALPSTSRDPSENWMSKTDPTPRFSRLGLAGEGVIMPVSAKSRKHVSRSGSIASLASNRSESFSAHTNPGLTMSRTTSTTSSLHTPTPSRFGDHGLQISLSVGEFGEVAPTDTEKRGSKRGLKRVMTTLLRAPSSLVKTRQAASKSAVDLPSQSKEPGSFRSKWNSIIASMRR